MSSVSSSTNTTNTYHHGRKKRFGHRRSRRPDRYCTGTFGIVAHFARCPGNFFSLLIGMIGLFWIAISERSALICYCSTSLLPILKTIRVVWFGDCVRWTQERMLAFWVIMGFSFTFDQIMGFCRPFAQPFCLYFVLKTLFFTWCSIPNQFNGIRFLNDFTVRSICGGPIVEQPKRNVLVQVPSSIPMAVGIENIEIEPMPITKPNHTEKGGEKEEILVLEKKEEKEESSDIPVDKKKKKKDDKKKKKKKGDEDQSENEVGEKKKKKKGEDDQSENEGGGKKKGKKGDDDQSENEGGEKKKKKGGDQTKNERKKAKEKKKKKKDDDDQPENEGEKKKKKKK